MTTQINVNWFVAELPNALVPVLEKEPLMAGDGEFRSPEFLDKLLWGVLVGFLVGTSANLFTAALIRLLWEKGVTKDELESITATVRTVRVEVSQETRRSVEEHVAGVLPRSLSSEERSRVSMELTEVILDKVSKH